MHKQVIFAAAATPVQDAALVDTVPTQAQLP